MHDRDHGDHEEPERRQFDDEAAQGLALGGTGFVREDHKKSHEESYHQPAGEAVRELEPVVQFYPEGWVCHDDDHEEEGEDHIGDDNGGFGEGVRVDVRPCQDAHEAYVPD